MTTTDLQRSTEKNINTAQPTYKASTLLAMEEARQISCDTRVPGYASLSELKAALLEED